MASILTAEMLSGVLDELLACLPIVLPISIGFIGIRKAISFVLGMISQA